jgi:hypothetical protein
VSGVVTVDWNPFYVHVEVPFRGETVSVVRALDDAVCQAGGWRPAAGQAGLDPWPGHRRWENAATGAGLLMVSLVPVPVLFSVGQDDRGRSDGAAREAATRAMQRLSATARGLGGRVVGSRELPVRMSQAAAHAASVAAMESEAARQRVLLAHRACTRCGAWQPRAATACARCRWTFTRSENEQAAQVARAAGDRLRELYGQGVRA